MRDVIIVTMGLTLKLPKRNRIVVRPLHCPKHPLLPFEKNFKADFLTRQKTNFLLHIWITEHVKFDSLFCF